MNYKKLSYERSSFILVLLSFVLLASGAVFAQTAKDNDRDLAQATTFIRANRYIDALPLLEKAAARYPADGEILANFGIAVIVNSASIKDAELRRKEYVRGSEILRKAKKLGTENVMALHFLDKIEAGQQVDVGHNASSKEVEDAIREGEGFFGRGEYEKAFTAYKRAYDLDPENYEAAVFAGDCYYSLKRYKEAEPWFAKAVSISRYNEAAHRFWGDALFYQQKIPQAMEKFADAVIAEPDSRLATDRYWEVIRENGKRKANPFIAAPGAEHNDDNALAIDPALLKTDDGTINWNRYAETRAQQKKAFEKVANGRKFEQTVSEDVQALKSVVTAVNAQVKGKKIVKLDASLENLVRLDELDMLDAYVIMFLHNGNRCPEFNDYREKNWDKLRRFLVEYIGGFAPANLRA